MKKTALLFTILCASALNGMETKRSVWDYLPQEIQSLIVKNALEVSDNIDQAINAIKTTSTLHGAEFDKLFGNLKSFTALVHVLAHKFNVTTAQVAHKFKTPIAQIYIKLGSELIEAAGSKHEKGLKRMTELINKGADVNFSSYQRPLGLAIVNANSEGIKLLLNAGAKPTDDEWNLAELVHWPAEQADTIKQLLKQAREE